MLKKLWHDEQGAIVSVEILVIATILVIGLMVAWVAVRNAVVVKINDQAEWISGEENDDAEQQGNDILTCSDVFGPGA